MSTTRMKRIGHIADRTIWWLTTIGGVVAAAAILGIMVLTVMDVAHREFVGGSIKGAVERSTMLLIVAAFMGLGVTQREGQHVASELFIEWLPNRVGRVLQTLGLLVAVALLAWLLYATGTKAWDSFQARESRFGLVVVPVWPGRVAIAVGLALMFIETVRQSVIFVFSDSPEDAIPVGTGEGVI